MATMWHFPSTEANMSSPSYTNHVGIFQNLYCESLSSCHFLHCSSAGKYREVRQLNPHKKKPQQNFVSRTVDLCTTHFHLISYILGSLHIQAQCDKRNDYSNQKQFQCPCENCLHTDMNNMSLFWMWSTVMFTAQWVPLSKLPVISY